MSAVYGESIMSTRTDWGTTVYQSRVATVCNHCSEIMIAIFSNDRDLSNVYLAVVREELEGARDVVWLPRTASAYTFPHVPASIARAAEEAHQDAEIRNYMSAILMARTTVEATAKDKGIEVRGLVAKINAMQEAGHIRRGIADAAHQIRHLGNDMAHGDLDDAPSEEDAEDVLALMDAVLRDVYETTAITAGIISRRRG